jgi:hypothetical protein
MPDRDPRMTDVFTRMLHAVDSLDWGTFRALFTAEVALDYTSLWGGNPERMSPDALAASWQEVAAGYDATQHLTGPIAVTRADEQTATCVTTVRAYHHVVQDGREPATWMVAGRYTVGLEHGADGWRISAITLSVSYEEGSREVVELARQRVAAGAGGRVGRG